MTPYTAAGGGSDETGPPPEFRIGGSVQVPDDRTVVVAPAPQTAAAGAPPERAARAAHGLTCCGSGALAADTAELASRAPAAIIPSNLLRRRQRIRDNGAP